MRLAQRKSPELALIQHHTCKRRQFGGSVISIGTVIGDMKAALLR